MRPLSRFRTIGVTLAMFGLLAAPIYRADAITVKPLVVDLKTSGRGMNQVVSVENTSAVAVPVQLTVQELVVEAGETHGTGKDPGDLLVFPPQALIQPGQTQTFRVQYVGDPALTKSKHYYITVAQLPVKPKEGESAVQVVFSFQVLASVGPQGAKPSLRVQSAGVGKNDAGKPVPVVTVANDSSTYGYLSHGKLRVIEKDAAGREVFRQTLSGPEIQQQLGMGLITSGQERKFTLAGVLPLTEGTIEAKFTPDN
ncbi:MAG: fimbria/pilus periplasmic chaperone [Sphingomonas sp.]|uniref:fimbria/pilus periplasmic chaperone n=1 Tax=Sphingomonas sp. TaxID=28214 RepID=UPI003568CE53